MIRITVSNRSERRQIDHPAGPIDFGRGPSDGTIPRCVLQDLFVSRNHLRLEERPGGLVRVENLSSRNPIRLSDNATISSGEARDFPLPLRLTLGETLIDVAPGGTQPPAAPASRPDALQTIKQPARPRRDAGPAPSLPALGDAPTVDTLAEWFETVLFVQQAAVGSSEFFQQTARALVDLVGLDVGMVLLRDGDGWKAVAHAVAREPGYSRGFSRVLVSRVVEERRTLYRTSPQDPALGEHVAESLMGVEAVVASPILDPRENVVGVLYGSRSTFSAGRGISIGPLEARVVQVLASAVAAGMARMEQEAEAARRRAQFEQFFSADLARELEQNPKLLEGRETVVTVLFSDIRGYSRLAERLGPRDACRLIGDVMERLTAHVTECHGVVVDYYGDGLLAMWNAPREHPDHAALACRAALAMLADLPDLAARWQDKVGEPLGLGVGLNTGLAVVGNTGSRHKFKYGPLGAAVNLASRVEGATKLLGVPALMTGSTRALVGDAFAVRRLGRARVVGVSDPVDLYELHAGERSPQWLQLRGAYETALSHCEAGRWAECRDVLSPLLPAHGDAHDGPASQLLARAVECLGAGPQAADPVWTLNTK